MHQTHRDVFGISLQFSNKKNTAAVERPLLISIHQFLSSAAFPIYNTQVEQVQEPLRGDESRHHLNPPHSSLISLTHTICVELNQFLLAALQS